MIIPVRCFTCGKLIGDVWEEFARRVKTGEEPRRSLRQFGD
jgi:DNA-directed RNA polymerase subunit N